MTRWSGDCSNRASTPSYHAGNGKRGTEENRRRPVEGWRCHPARRFVPHVYTGDCIRSTRDGRHRGYSLPRSLALSSGDGNACVAPAQEDPPRERHTPFQFPSGLGASGPRVGARYNVRAEMRNHPTNETHQEKLRKTTKEEKETDPKRNWRDNVSTSRESLG